MKRKLAVLLAVLFTVTMILPVGGFAASMDKALENAIKIAKTKFTIPDDYKFNSSINTQNKKNVFNLYWRSPDAAASSNISVTIDGDGVVIGYYKYSQSDYIQTKKLPKFGRQEAKAKADGYIRKIEPGLIDKLRYEENTQSNVIDMSYYLTYCRVVNGLPFYSDRVSLNINRETGELQNYSRQWTDNLSFPSPDGSISISDAQKAYSKNLGLRLIYKYSNTDDVLRVFAVYAPIYSNSSYAIDAKTGERLRIGQNYSIGFDESISTSAANKSAVVAAAGAPRLSPDEQKAVQNASKLMSQEEAEKIARNMKFLNLTSENTVDSYYLSENWPSKEDYVWSLQFKKPAGDKRAYDEYTNVTVNAKTGEIISFYRGGQPTDASAKPKGDMATAKAAVDAFLKEYYPQYVRQTEYDKLAGDNSDNGSNTFFTFAYCRLVNGIPFPDNGLNINYDNVSGMITGFNMNWFNIAFPSVDKAIGVPAATEKLFTNVGLSKEYRLEYQQEQNAARDMAVSKIAGPSENSGKVAAVYLLKPSKPLFLDAFTGSLLNTDGSEYKASVKVNYTDIKGNAAEKQIMVLADNGIYLDGTQFLPDNAITQQDFLILLSRTMNYYSPYITAKGTSRETDDLYAFLQREGVVKAGEKAPSANVTREEAVKYLVRALKYDKVADIKGIFNISFKDKSGINPSLAGYVAIAAGLGIVDTKSAYFKPKAKLTRGEAAVMIYNYLQS